MNDFSSSSPALDQLVLGNPDELTANIRRQTNGLLTRSNDSIVFFGAGPLGKIALERLRQTGRQPVAFADNNPEKWGSHFHDVPVFSPEKAVERFGKNSLFVITVYTSTPVWTQLRSLGVEPLSLARLAWALPMEFLPHGAMDLPNKIFEQKARVRAAFERWSDEESRAGFVEQIQWRTTLAPEILRPHLPAAETYFPADLFTLKENEVFVDCGAFDGDSIRAFIGHVKGRFNKIIGLEPDPLNRGRFEKFKTALPDEQRHRIELLPYAVGERHEQLVFNITGTAGSVIGSGETKVQCVLLDAVIKTSSTFIKMDIEGAEPAALRGAEKLIRSSRPILAVCLYHAQEHLWDIPLHLDSILENYNFYLRRYSDECWELVLYAVPKERCLKN